MSSSELSLGIERLLGVFPSSIWCSIQTHRSELIPINRSRLFRIGFVLKSFTKYIHWRRLGLYLTFLLYLSILLLEHSLQKLCFIRKNEIINIIITIIIIVLTRTPTQWFYFDWIGICARLEGAFGVLVGSGLQAAILNQSTWIWRMYSTEILNSV